jgi:hypothetical protein
MRYLVLSVMLAGLATMLCWACGWRPSSIRRVWKALMRNFAHKVCARDDCERRFRGVPIVICQLGDRVYYGSAFSLRRTLPKLADEPLREVLLCPDCACKRGIGVPGTRFLGVDPPG